MQQPESGNPAIRIGIYGVLRPHSWIDSNVLGTPPDSAASENPKSKNAYSLFYSRSVGMGWAAPGDGYVATKPLWKLEKAGFGEGNRAENSLVAWFQIGILPKSLHPLPIAQALACAHDTVCQVGKLRLDTIQITVPPIAPSAGLPARKRAPGTLPPGTQIILVMNTSGKPPQGPSPSARAMVEKFYRQWSRQRFLRTYAPLSENWFHPHDPEGLTAVRATVDGGTVMAIDDHPQEEVLEMLQTFASYPFRFVAVSRSPADFVEPAPPVVSEDCFPPGRDRVTFEILSPGWSIDTAAWIANNVLFVADTAEPLNPLTISIGPTREML